MAEKGRLAVVDGVRGKFHIKTHELPKVEPNTCLIKTELTGLCATDVRYWMGNEPTYAQTFPALYGHEICGEIIAVGEGYDKDYLGKPLKVGDRLAVKPMQQCGRCYWCATAHLPMKCYNAKSYGDTGYHAPWHLGGFSEYVYLCYPQGEVFKTDLPPETAVMLDPLTNAINGINRGKQRVGDTIVVQGSGPIGLLTILTAKHYGASKAIMVGGPKNRLKVAKELGADLTIDINEIKDPKERIGIVREESNDGKGADVVYECAGFPSTIPEGIDYLRYGGTYVEVGHFSDAGEVSINPAHHICSKCVTIVGAWASENEHYVQAMSLMETRFQNIGKLVSHKVPLEGIEDAFKALASDYMLDGREIIKVAVNPWMK